MGISTDKGGTRRVTFTLSEGKRGVIRLGAVSMKTAREVDAKVRAIVASKRWGTPLDSSVEAWLCDLEEDIYAKIVTAGLVKPRRARERVTVGGLLDAFQDAHEGARTSALDRADRTLREHFGETRDASAITEGEAEDWRVMLVEHEYASATIARTVKYARQVWKWGTRRALVTRNPFAELRAGSMTNPERQAFVTRETVAKVSEALPDDDWRLLLALSRFGGVRVPSEGLALRWADVNWEHNRLWVRSPKTAHHEGKGGRWLPLFPELVPHLRAAFERAEDGAVMVFEGKAWREGFNPHTTLKRAVKRAGVDRWPRLWHSLRGSRQTELATRFPLHCVCGWLGNSPTVAHSHYLSITDADFERAISTSTDPDTKSGTLAARNPTRREHASARAEGEKSTQLPEGAALEAVGANSCENGRTSNMGPEGLEPSLPFPGSGF